MHPQPPTRLPAGADPLALGKSAPIPVVYAPGFTLVGDVHGCRTELEALLRATGHALATDDAGAVLDAVHPQGYLLGFVGDLGVKGPDTVGTLRLVRALVAQGRAVCVAGNNDAKLARALLGGGARGAVTAAMHQCRDAMDLDEQLATGAFLADLPSHAVLRAPGARDCVLVHAGIEPNQIGRTDAQTRLRCIVGTVNTRLKGADGRAIRSHAWAESYAAPWAPHVVYGHTEVTEVASHAKTRNIDTGCVGGGALSALAWPSGVITAVPAAQAYIASTRLTPAELFVEIAKPVIAVDARSMPRRDPRPVARVAAPPHDTSATAPRPSGQAARRPGMIAR